jgi:hypothetical protein
MTTYHLVFCSACTSLDVAGVTECDGCDLPFCRECMEDGMCETCYERERAAFA